MTDDSSPIASPAASQPGCANAGPAAVMAGPVTAAAATTMAMTRPDDPLNRRPVDRLSRMYAAQQVAATRANVMPAASVLRPRTGPARPAPPALLALPASPAPPSVSSSTPAAASTTHAPSSSRWEDATATTSGPRNSIVTATPSGIRAND